MFCLPDHSVSINSSSFHKENSDTIMKPAFLKSPLHHRHDFILYVSLLRFHLSHRRIFCTSLFCNVDSSSRRKLEIKLKGTWACGPNVNVYVTTARIYTTEVFFCCCAAVQHHLYIEEPHIGGGGEWMKLQQPTTFLFIFIPEGRYFTVSVHRKTLIMFRAMKNKNYERQSAALHILVIGISYLYVCQVSH